jgi:hypothetical protein
MHCLLVYRLIYCRSLLCNIFEYVNNSQLNKLCRERIWNFEERRLAAVYFGNWKPRCSDVQKISGPFFAAEAASMTVDDWPSLRITRSLLFPDFQAVSDFVRVLLVN